MTLNAIVPRAPKNSLVKPIPIRLMPDEMQKVEKFAGVEMRSRSSFMRVIFIRGLEQYERELAARQ